MDAKAKVLTDHPQAYCERELDSQTDSYYEDGQYYILVCLGSGDTEEQAWAKAAESLKRAW